MALGIQDAKNVGSWENRMLRKKKINLFFFLFVLHFAMNTSGLWKLYEFRLGRYGGREKVAICSDVRDHATAK